MNSTRDQGRPKQFYPVYVNPNGETRAHDCEIGEPIARGIGRNRRRTLTGS